MVETIINKDGIEQHIKIFLELFQRKDHNFYLIEEEYSIGHYVIKREYSYHIIEVHINAGRKIRVTATDKNSKKANRTVIATKISVTQSRYNAKNKTPLVNRIYKNITKFNKEADGDSFLEERYIKQCAESYFEKTVQKLVPCTDEKHRNLSTRCYMNDHLLSLALWGDMFHIIHNPAKDKKSTDITDCKFTIIIKGRILCDLTKSLMYVNELKKKCDIERLYFEHNTAGLNIEIILLFNDNIDKIQSVLKEMKKLEIVKNIIKKYTLSKLQQ